MARMRRFVVAAVALAGLSAAAPAGAALDWQPTESLPAQLTVNLGADGTGLLFGDPLGGAFRALVRPNGGPVGAPEALPANFGSDTNYSLVVGYFPDGSSLIADGSDNRVAFRPAGAGSAIGTPQYLGSAVAPTKIATVASGQALIGLDGNPSAPVGVALRSAGPGGTVDMANAQFFGHGRLIGVALDPAGGAVVVFIPDGSSALEQSVRNPGDSTFQNPVPIPGGPFFQVSMATDPSGNAVLGWLGGPAGTDGFPTQVTAALRVPGGAFGAPHVIQTQAHDEPITVMPAMTANGDGVLAWTGNFTPGGCASGGPGNDGSVGGYVATSHLGLWGPNAAVAGVAWPSTSLIDGVAAAGNSVAIAFSNNIDHDAGSKCASSLQDDSRAQFVRAGTSTPNGIVFDSADHAATTPVPLTDGTGRYYNGVFEGLAVTPSGGALYEYNQGSPSGVVHYLQAREDRTTPGPGPGPGPTPGPGPGVTPPGGVVMQVLPIVPRNLVLIPPILQLPPTIVFLCPPDVTDCAMRVGAYQAFGAVPVFHVPKAAKKRQKTAKLLGVATITLRGGTRGTAKIKFNAAGRRALRPGRRLKLRIVVNVRAGTQHGSFTTKTTVSARHRNKRKH